MRKAFRIMLRVAAALAIVVIVAAGVFAWRLSQGPIEVGFLTPYLQRALSASDQDVRVSAKRTVLAWSGWGRGVQLQARELSVVHANGEPLAEIPVISIRLSLRALIVGEVAPIAITVHRPQLYLERSAEGRISLALHSKPARKSRFVPGLLSALASDKRGDGPLRLMTAIRIEDAELNIDDRYLGRVWRTKNLSVTIARKDRVIRSTMTFDLTVGKEAVRFAAYGSYDLPSKLIGLDLSFKSLDPAMFASARGALQALGWFKMPVGGTFRLKVRDGTVTAASFDLTGREGAIGVPGLYDQPLAVTAFKTKGRVLADGRRLRIETFEADFKGTKVSISGVFSGLDGPLGFGGSVAIEALPVNDLPKFWPRDIKQNARNWVAENLSGGMVRSLDMRIELQRAGPNGKLGLSKLHGAFRYAGMSVRFQRLLPPIKQVSGFATFSERDLRFTLEDGDLDGVALVRGRVDIVEFDKPIQRIEIEAKVAGKLADILTVIDRKPLQFARRLGVNPLAVGGTAEATIKSGFILRREVDVDTIDITANAVIRGLSWRKGMFDQDLTDGNFTLDIAKTGMVLDGRTLLGGVAAKLRWEEAFGKPVKIRRKYALETSFTVDMLGKMGVDVGHVFDGSIGAKLEVDGYDTGLQIIRGEFDLGKASITVPFFGARKPRGAPAQAKATFIVGAGRLRSLERVHLRSAIVEAKGSARFHPDGVTLKELKVEMLRTGRQDLSATIVGAADGAKRGTIAGASLDVPAIMKARSKSGPAGTGPGEVPQLDLTLNVARVYFGKDRFLTGFRGSLGYSGKRITHLSIVAGVPDGRPLSVEVSRKGAVRRLTMKTNDAGAAFRALDLVDTLKGGVLSVSAVSRSASAPFSGRARLSKFRVAQAPVLARILALASLTGISNLSASDEGVAFEEADIPFHLREGLLTIVNARAVGSQIGITLSGDVRLGKDNVALRGTIVPAYTLNSLLGKLPLVGRALVGEKGSGIFAARYTVRGSLANPSLNVNPLSVLAPGFLRNIFGGGGQDAPVSDNGGAISAPGIGSGSGGNGTRGGKVLDHDRIGR